jgi:hypothetical protein
MYIVLFNKYPVTTISVNDKHMSVFSFCRKSAVCACAQGCHNIDLTRQLIEIKYRKYSVPITAIYVYEVLHSILIVREFYEVNNLKMSSDCFEY